MTSTTVEINDPFYIKIKMKKSERINAATKSNRARTRQNNKQNMFLTYH